MGGGGVWQPGPHLERLWDELGGPEFPHCIPSLPRPQRIAITPPSSFCQPHLTPLIEEVNWEGKLRQGEEVLVERTQASCLSALNGRGVQS